MTIGQTMREMRELMREKSRLLDDIDRARCAATSIGGIGDGQPRATAVEPKVEKGGILCADLEKKLKNVDLKLKAFSEDIKPHIESTPDCVAAEMLRRRYMQFQSVQLIAVGMGYTRDAVYKRLRVAEHALKR